MLSDRGLETISEIDSINDRLDTGLSIIPDVHKEALPAFILPKSVKADKPVPFDKDKSVFKAWSKDTEATLRKALEFDLGYWKAAKFVKDPEDFKACEALIRKNFKHLKHMFVNVSSGDNYPHIGWNEFNAFCI